jgi:DTW domain-containing protein YfiP
VAAGFDAGPRLRALANDPAGAAVLFPGVQALDPSALATPPRTLIVVDGTWNEARKMLARMPWLAGLPHLRLTPAAPGVYRRIRRTPAAHQLSTVEAVIETLARLEGGRHRFAPLLRALDHVVATQLVAAATRRRPYTHEHRSRRRRRA